MKRIEGGICAVSGVRAAGAREGKYGVAIIAASGTAAGMFTTNKIRAAPLDLTAKNLTVSGGHLEGIIANSGSANAYTGIGGMADARATARLLADFLNTDEKKIAVASTGVIGRRMNMELIAKLFDQARAKLRSSPEASLEAAKAIMTTDTKVKEIAIEYQGVRVAGIVKGAGMIEPNLATMLCFLYTDVDMSPSSLKDCLAEAVKDSFNMLTIDGDTSTNDIVLLTATGVKKCNPETFQQVLGYVCVELARMIARDGEGAGKYFETIVCGAKNENDARAAAKAVARSSLVKTAVYGSDPNWGRIIAAIGRSGAEVNPQLISLSLDGSGYKVALVEKGVLVEGVLDQAKKIMEGNTIMIYVDLGMGKASARSFGCDLTHGYVDINANYTT
ncbi:MAG: bifunctional ornithine acetyltransferase/N-acetylglutamate synthase [Methanotrichaceae archaeon]|nr:bifunctional ornithine acetyltransferase/N-acetylglutamate synthase [Methanotrichaceae archaeon]